MARPRTTSVRAARAFGPIALAAALALPSIAGAAEIRVRGDAPFRVPPAAVLQALPADAPIRADDVRSGTLGFEIAYDDATPDADPDPTVGRYDAGVRAFRVRVGGTWIDLPAPAAQLRVSDGGGGMAHRESVTLTSTARYGALELRAGWMLIHQVKADTDLRGAAGSIASDALPRGDGPTRFATSGDLDRVFFVRLDPVGDASKPVLYLSTSSLAVKAAPATGSER